jgi:hypothetical protein
VAAPQLIGRVVIPVVFWALVAGCSAQAPTAPGHVDQAAIIGPTNAAVSIPETAVSAPVRAKARTVRTIDLLEGTVTLSLADGSTIRGSYHGTFTAADSGPARSTLDGVVTGGTGLFAGATGSLSGTGTGGFADNGEFSVALRASLPTSKGGPGDVRMALKGISTSTCTTTAPPRMMLDGTGGAKGFARATGHLEHNLGNHICAIPAE